MQPIVKIMTIIFIFLLNLGLFNWLFWALPLFTAYEFVPREAFKAPKNQAGGLGEKSLSDRRSGLQMFSYLRKAGKDHRWHNRGGDHVKILRQSQESPIAIKSSSV